MARVKNPVIGGYSGRIGNHVYRVIKGKTYVSIRPQKYNASKSVAAKRARKDFSSVVKLAQAVNLVPALKKIWLASEVEGFSPYHKIIRTNSSLVKDGKLTPGNIITPEGLYLQLSSLTVQNNILNAVFTFTENSAIKFPAELFFLFCFQENNTILSVSQIIDEPGLGGEYSVSISLNVRVKTLLKQDSNPLVFMALTGSVPSRKKIYWSITVGIQL